MKPFTILLILCLLFLGCSQSTATENPASAPAIATAEKTIINDQGQTIQTRFNPPPGFTRTEIDDKSFANYLRNLPLKPAGTKVKYKKDHRFLRLLFPIIQPIQNGIFRLLQINSQLKNYPYSGNHFSLNGFLIMF